MELKERMNWALSSIKTELKTMKKKQAAAQKVKKPDFRLDEQIELAETQKKFYMSTKTEPVRFENGIVVNAKLVRAYLKKLPHGAVITPELFPEGLKIRWKTPSGQGNLVCLNLAHRYESFELPAAESLFEEETQ